jgi:hypothetical protein
MSVTQFHIRPALRRLADGLEASAARRSERRQHDLVMADPAMAVEHSIQIGRGLGTCPYCR